MTSSSTSETHDATNAAHRGGVAWMREASPYIRAHRGQTFVVFVGGEVLEDGAAEKLAQDLILLSGLGIRVVVVHGARPQINARLAAAGLEPALLGDVRVTDAKALACVKTAVAAVRMDLEAALVQAALYGANRSAAVTVSGGNFVTARPAGVIQGVDLHYTGEVRRVDRDAIRRRLEHGELVLVSPLGYSPTGETFNLNALDLAVAVACDIEATKLILTADPPGIVDADGALVRHLTVVAAREFEGSPFAERLLARALRALQLGVERVHVVDRTVDGAIIEELFTRDGVGTMISRTPADHLRRATIDDVGGILALIEPLERDGTLVKRSREKLEMEIDHFSVIVREDVVVACGALHAFPNATGEIACIAVHPGYRSDGFGVEMLRALEQRAVAAGLQQVFVLTTQAVHWFLEAGYERMTLDTLPVERKALYNVQRNSVVLRKEL